MVRAAVSVSRSLSWPPCSCRQPWCEPISPTCRGALSQLQAAKASSQAASHSKGGHRRVNAINLINQAIVEVQLGIDLAR